MIVFPETSFPEDIKGNGSADALADLVSRKNYRYVEIRFLESEDQGYLSGSFGEF